MSGERKPGAQTSAGAPVPLAGRGTYRHGDLREALLTAGVEMARHGGPDAVVLREATRRAGVTPNAAYRHFADRGALLRAVSDVAQGLAADAMEREVEAAAARNAAAGSAAAGCAAEGSGGAVSAAAGNAAEGRATAGSGAEGSGAAVSAVAGSAAAGSAAAGGAGGVFAGASPGGTTADGADEARLMLRAVGTGYLGFARDEPGLFRAAFSVPDHLDNSGDGAKAGAGGRTPFQILGAALDLWAAAGILLPERRANAELFAWSAVHGLGMLVIDGPLRGLSAQMVDGATVRVLDMVERGL